MDFKKMGLGQLIGIAAGIFVLMMVIAGLVISANSKPANKVVQKRAPVQFESQANDIAIEQLRAEIKELRELIDAHARASQSAFSQTAQAIEQQGRNIGILDSNFQITANRVTSLEKSKIGTRVNVIKPDDLPARPTRAERLAAERKDTRALTLAGGDVKPMAVVGHRAWIRNGNEEFSVAAGDPIPVSGQLRVRQVSPNGQVSVSVENER